MSLTVGASVGPYEIVSLLGVGGPPSLNAAFGRSSGGSPEAKETTR
jgi:hypothetical protein